MAKKKKFNVNIPLNPKQVEMYNVLMSGDYSEFLFYGTSRSGKTFLILYWMIVQSIAFKANCLVVRQTFTSLSMGMIQQTLPAVLNAIAKLNGKTSYQKLYINGKPFARYNGKDNLLKLYNGAYIQFASIRSGADGDSAGYDKILSTEWGHIFLDEVSEIDYSAVEILISRLAQKMEFPNCMLFALNPSTKLHWTYKRFFENKTLDGEQLSDDIVKQMFKMHFGAEDNQQFVSSKYFATLSSLSSSQRQRFLDGEYADIGSGKIFRNLKWVTRPKIDEILECIIYTDPSAKDGKHNDFKASVTLVRTRDQRIWLWDCRAVQGTSSEMLENIYDLYVNAPMIPRVIMEKKQLPLDYESTYRRFQIEKNWTAPIIWDTLNHGNKFTCIESTLEPLVNTGRFVFTNELKKCGCYEQIIDQFVRFSASESKSIKDDIPDACAKGTTFLNYNIVQQSTSTSSPALFYRCGKLTSTRIG